LAIPLIATTGRRRLALNPTPAFGFTSAANSEVLPQSETTGCARAIRRVFDSQRRCRLREWPNIRRFEHFLKLLDVVNDALNVHASQSSSTNQGTVNLKRQLDA